jgi:hypothetical protein
MIKQKEININIVGRNLKYYNNLGYNCKVGYSTLVKIEDVQLNSHIIITAICDNCNQEHNISIYAYNKNKKNQNKYYCNDCKQIKIENTNIIKYGVKRPIQNKEIYNKLEKTNFEKFGCLVSSQNFEVMNKIKKSQINTLLKKYDFLNIKKIKSGLCTIECDKHHIYDINFSLLNLRLKYKTILCPICNPISSTKSGLEIQFKEFISDNYDNKIILNSRSIIPPLELDIYLPDLNLAFEFNGLFWHCELNKEKDYHINKTHLCENQGVQLMHIYEDDWKYKQEIVKSIIINKLGKTENKIFNKKTEIREINDNILVNDFLESNHIQGYIESKINIGLFYDNILVSLMTFDYMCGKYILLQFCNKLNTIVIDSETTLIKYFIDKYNPIELISIVDRSLCEDDLYVALGFKFNEKIKPDYSYIINGIRKSKANYQKKILIKNGSDSNKTEHEIMLEQKIFRIYNSGYIKYKLNL